MGMQGEKPSDRGLHAIRGPMSASPAHELFGASRLADWESSYPNTEPNSNQGERETAVTCEVSASLWGRLVVKYAIAPHPQILRAGAIQRKSALLVAMKQGLEPVHRNLLERSRNM